MEDDRLEEYERLQMQRIRELDMEELEIEEVDSDLQQSDDDGEDPRRRVDGGADSSGGITFNMCLAPLHTYLGEVDDTHGRVAFLDGGAVLNLPMFYLQGVVLFPEATLPLRVIEPGFIAAVERALNQVDAPCTIGVVRVNLDPNGYRFQCSTIGTTAEIRQYRRLDDGSLNVVARGQQRFHVRRRWMDVEGAPCAEVQIIQEDVPLRTPKDAFAKLSLVRNFPRHTRSHGVHSVAPHARCGEYEVEENTWEAMSDTSSNSYYSPSDTIMEQPGSEPVYDSGLFDDPVSSDDENALRGRDKLIRCDNSLSRGSRRDHVHEKASTSGSTDLKTCKESSTGRNSGENGKLERDLAANNPRWLHKAPMTFWPHWVYEMYDSYSLAQRAADMWRQIIGYPRMDELIRKPDLLSFHIGSKVPVSESTRQELLEIDGISYRLRREIQILESLDQVRCKNCLTVIAKRSDMVVMSSDGPLNAYVNPHGYVHEVMTLHNASGLVLRGSPVKEHSWFPGYAWTVTNCAVCETNMGWLFTATKKGLLPRLFWGIRSSQVADTMQ
ncbi:hypothetical protein QJS10_CPB18g01014 [Acorus calamus]|uniref:Protein cereblon n=1 Tax=Acorus calamus TaxID=4465 RepID=A0AAV9CP25_ACOCL|nr:hypothetical protein QJS10_CPB18g01014 [Acorus calamus]